MKITLLATGLLMGLGLALPAQAIDLGQPLSADEKKFSGGVHYGFSSGGLSIKYRYTDSITVQGTAGLLGSLSNFGARGLYTFKSDEKYSLYGFGGVGLWKIGGFFNESALGFGAGAGAEYEVLPDLLLSAELGLGMVNFDSYTGFSSVGLGLGAHYRF